MIFNFNTETKLISAKGLKSKWECSPELLHYLQLLENAINENVVYVGSEPTHYRYKDSCIEFGTQIRTLKAENLVKADPDNYDYSWETYFKFDLSDYKLKDVGGNKISKCCITSNLNCLGTPTVCKSNSFSDTSVPWLKQFWGCWGLLTYASSKKQGRYYFSLTARELFQLKCAEKFYRSGFLFGSQDMKHLLEQFSSDDLIKNEQSPWKILGVPKTVWNSMIKHIDICQKAFEQYGSFSRIKEFKGWDRLVFAFAEDDPERIKFILDLIISREVEEFEDLILDKSYDPKRLVDYILTDLPEKQGLTSSSIGLKLLKDYAGMSHAVFGDNWEKYPKALKTEHDIVMIKFNELAAALKETKRMEIYKSYDLQWLSSKYFEEIDRAGKKVQYTYSMIIPESSEDIVDEAKEQCHCVASYINCLSKNCLITFIRARKSGCWGSFQKRLTIEIDAENKLIKQARGRYNRVPNLNEFQFLIQYCNAKGFTMNPSVRSLFDKKKYGTTLEKLEEKERGNALCAI